MKLDNRSLEKVREELSRLAESYVPEWHFDQKNPDIGSVLALLFSEQLYGNIERFNQALERYHTEFVNLLDSSLLPAHPASATVLMELVPDTVSELPIEQGTKLLADQEGEKLVFETVFPVCLSGARLQAVFMATAKQGKVVPLYGDFPEFDYAGKPLRKGREGREGTEEENVLEATAASNALKPFTLFDFDQKGLERHAMLFYHSRLFDVEGEILYCRISGNSEISERIARGEFRFLYYTSEGFLPVEQVQVKGDEILLVKEQRNQKVLIEGKAYGLLVLEAVELPKESMSFDSIAFSSAGAARPIEYAGNGTTDFGVNRFEPFGDRLALYEECYIGMDHYFSRAGAKVTLQFRADYGERFTGIAKREESGELKIIKRKPRVSVEAMISYAYAEEISLEYFNGIGWKRLECEQEYRKMFAEAESGEYELSFFCPADWEPVSAGAYHGRTLRMQLLRADNCYYQPCIHRYPIVSGMNVSYTYESHFEKPELGCALCGTSRIDFTKQLQENRPFVGFSSGNYSDTALYVGFDQVFENGPVSLWWKLAEPLQGESRKLHYYYSTTSGFKEMKVVDYTEGLTRTGIMLFLAASDMGFYTLEEKRLCWIKIVEERGEAGGVITQIALNAVEVQNIETLEEEDFYLDTIEKDMSVPLPADGILDAKVWVNERGELSESAMRRMLQEAPDQVRATFDYRGGIREFFVKWEEQANFVCSTPNSRHYVLDRMQGRLLFGDGIHVKIPQNTEGTAFTVQVRRCRGQKGNVAAGAIGESSANLMYIQRIYNPEAAFGGSNMETLERALKRGAARLSSGGRFVSEKDYIQEAVSFSENIEKAAMVVGTDAEGNRKERMLYLILLMRDFEEGSDSFYRMQKELKEHLLKHCELTITPEELQVTEPLFVELSVDVWAQVMRLEDSFEIQNLVEETLRHYLNPVAGERGKGWEIGVLPRKAQIVMRLNALKSRAIMKQVLVTARYTDSQGVHEMDLDDMQASPFMVVKSGRHRIHIIKAE